MKEKNIKKINKEAADKQTLSGKESYSVNGAKIHIFDDNERKLLK